MVLSRSFSAPRGMSTTRIRPNPEITGLNPDASGPDPAMPRLRDGWIRVGGAIFFGLVIPRVTELLGKFTWQEPEYWLGTGWFVLTAAALWEGNRAIMLRLRAALQTYPRLLWRLIFITAACVTYTVPVTIVAVALWQRLIGAPYPTENWAVVSLVTTNTVVAAVFVVQAYEMLFLQKERERDQLRLARLERARLLAELQSMQGQLAPHFLFNCLNTLAALIQEDPRAAAAFNQHLADVSRYLLARRQHDLVPLADELTFLHAYLALMELRFPRSLRVRLVGFDRLAGLSLPPAALQLLVENAIKHNRFDSAEPLPVEVALQGDRVVVSNPVRAKPFAPPSPGIGLANLRERVLLLSGRLLEVTRGESEFRVVLPLVQGRAEDRGSKTDRSSPAPIPSGS